MNKTLVILVVGALLVGGFIGYIYAPQAPIAPDLGAVVAANVTTVSNPWVFSSSITNSGTLKVGANGSTITEMKATTCDLIGTTFTQPATTSVAYDCAVTGVASGDVVFAQLKTATGTVGSWDITRSMASTTAGYITVLLTNHTGVTAVPSATAVGSSTNVFYIDN
jgi:hypothetical protein